MSAFVVKVLSALLVVGFCSADVVEFVNCPPTDDEPTFVGHCTVHEVRISPCPEAAQKKPCGIKRGKTASIEFDYTPHVASSTLIGKAFWTTSMADLPFVGMNIDACGYTPCPLQPEHKQSYVYQLSISKKFPVRQYDVKWRLYNEENINCCFITKIKLTK